MVKLMTGASEELDIFKGKERRKDWEMARWSQPPLAKNVKETF